MANLSVPQLQALILAPTNKARIQACWEQHQRLKLHVEPIAKARDVNRYAYTDLMQWIEALLPKDKYEQFKRFMRFPLPTVAIAEKIHTELSRALEAENQYVRAEFKDPANAIDFDNYRSKSGDDVYWLTEGMDLVKTKINSVIIIDLPSTQITDRPEPYTNVLEICPKNIWDVDFKKDGQAEYIIFWQGKNKLHAYDDSYFRVFTRPDNGGDFALETEIRHSVFSESGQLLSGPGYCPARRFWDDLLADNHIEAKAPLAKVFGRLDEYIFDFYSLRYAKSYGSWPFMWEYENTEPKHIHPIDARIVCQKGVFLVPQPPIMENTPEGPKEVAQRPLQVPCEECIKSKYTGPGSIKRVTAPNDKTDADLREPFGWINPSPEVLAQVKAFLDADKVSIIDEVVGFGGESTNAMARNEKDVEAGFEGKQSVMLDFKANFEGVIKWEMETKAIFRYQRNSFLRGSADLGDEFYLQSEKQLADNYAAGKKAGLPGYLLAPTRELISDTRFRGNDEQRMRQRILANLEPYPDRTDLELQAWVTAAPETLAVELLMLKLNFDAYVRRFEREQQMSLVDVASNISFDAKIALIQSELYRYAKEDAGKTKLAPKVAPAAPAPPVPMLQ